MEKKVTNSEIAGVFEEIADILDLQGENVFKIRAYRRAAQLLEGLEKPLSEIEELEELPGIGKELAEKIRILLRGEPLSTLVKLRETIEPGMLDLLKVRGLGPKRVKALHDQLKVKNLADLKKALEGPEILELPKFGPKLVDELKKGLGQFQEYSKRSRLDVAKDQAEELVEYLKKVKGLERAEPAGSLRRRLETIGDIDILVTGKDPGPVMDHFLQFPEAREVLSKGDTKSSVVLKNGIQVDVRFLAPDKFGAGLVYFTGSKQHNIAIRTIGKQKGLKVSEYGVFRGEKIIAGKTEEEVYQTLGLAWIPPELREDRGEIQAAKDNKLPQLIELKDVKGDLQVHTTHTDGRNKLEDMVAAAKEMGYQYIAVTDHSKSQHQTGGLDARKLLAEFAEIDALNKKLKDFVALKGVELDILKDGSLDLPESALKQADIVLGSIHGNFNLGKDQQTERVLKALRTGLVQVLAHPTTRLIGEREGIELDWAKIAPVMARMKIAVEINASPHRLDVNGELAKHLKDQGCVFSLGTDAHQLGGLREMEYGIYTARRGWLGASDVINTRPRAKLKKWLEQKRGT